MAIYMEPGSLPYGYETDAGLKADVLKQVAGTMWWLDDEEQVEISSTAADSLVDVQLPDLSKNGQ